MVEGRLMEVCGLLREVRSRCRTSRCKASWLSFSSWLHCDVQKTPTFGAKLGRPSFSQQRRYPLPMMACPSLWVPWRMVFIRLPLLGEKILAGLPQPVSPTPLDLDLMEAALPVSVLTLPALGRPLRWAGPGQQGSGSTSMHLPPVYLPSRTSRRWFRNS